MIPKEVGHDKRRNLLTLLIVLVVKTRTPVIDW